jgi:hypothetical protein
MPSHDHTVELQNLLLEPTQLSPKCCETHPRNLGQPVVIWIGDDIEQFLDTFASDRGDDPELGKMGPNHTDHSGLLTDEQMTRAMERQTALLLERLGRNEPHVDPGDCFADGLHVRRAIFTEIGKLVIHPRCMNCHPAGDHPLQGAERREHWPPAWRGESGAGVPGASCAMCPTGGNFTLHEAATYQSIPGHPRWQLAPLSMSWEGKTLGDICRQLKDASRNGGRDLAKLQEHFAKDDPVAWAWNPGLGREPAPGSQELAGKLVQAWIDSGAQCP